MKYTFEQMPRIYWEVMNKYPNEAWHNPLLLQMYLMLIGSITGLMIDKDMALNMEAFEK